MGGGGSSKWSYTDPKELLDRQQDKSKLDDFDSRVAELLGSLLVDYNDRDSEAIGRHVEEIKRALEKEIDGTVDLQFGGSVQKHTYIDGISDVDSVVFLDDPILTKKNPQEVKQYFLAILRERFPKTEIEEGSMSIKVHFADSELQLLPAIKMGEGFKIPNEKGSGWSRVDPKVFSRKLSSVNQNLGSKLVPTIKLAKAIVNQLPEQQRLTGYHLEALAVDVFSSYKGRPITTKEMLKYFFAEAASRVMTPMRDESGQSTYVDKELGGARSIDRQIVADSLARIGRRLEKADLGLDLSTWKEIFKL